METVFKKIRDIRYLTISLGRQVSSWFNITSFNTQILAVQVMVDSSYIVTSLASYSMFRKKVHNNKYMALIFTICLINSVVNLSGVKRPSDTPNLNK